MSTEFYYKAESRRNWHESNRPDGIQTLLRRIEVGAIQRIADATEAMAKSHTQLIREKEWAIESRDAARQRADELERRLSATRGVVTRLKRKLAALSEGGQGDE